MVGVVEGMEEGDALGSDTVTFGGRIHPDTKNNPITKRIRYDNFFKLLCDRFIFIVMTVDRKAEAEEVRMLPKEF